jgi:hypothetical protein
VAGLGLALTFAGLPAESQIRDLKSVETRDERIISTQVRLALPEMVRGYEMLTRSADQQEAAAAVSALYDSYRYLRAAQHGTEIAYNFGPFGDPLLKLRIDRIWQIRRRLLTCVDNREHLGDTAHPVRAKCLEGLPDGIRSLRILVATLP